ncbi:hypothetical protein M438DRAFT_349252 [Aureobasidium pullulans EXF-150]|uniref:DNA-binding protein RAP1 n=1 Tax=Aureobasidium pullulans EXF-150 TaxID=1043002 RepID=A0A074X3L2_AURPU|nr:uncharacterized protein M438DRAFT_349252 [Aureobasidium pullulans EXF-150]KEQ79998.1 hypothetical protein M438DRAFT_349252 [Aureobasidium pullulans EXF-150]
MPPAVVYTDMDDSAGVQGGIFDGLKFFIVQRVPQRSHYVSLVESNAGSVVKLEAQADYLIADHVRHDAPPGSLSYKFIETAIKEGSVPEDESKFLAGRPKSTNPITTNTLSSRKATRTPFTTDDDKILYKWVQKANNSGLALQGNKIYQILAAHNNRHTYQSWRDRYVKALASRPPSGWEDHPDESLPSLASSIADLSSTALPRSTPIVRPSTSPMRTIPKAREKFTDEDDEELISWVRRAYNKGEALQGNELYKKLAARNPRHSYQSWRGHWVDLLQHTVDLDEEVPAEDDAPVARPSPSPEPPISRPPVKRAAFRVPPAASASAASPLNRSPQSIAPHSVIASEETPSQSVPSASRPATALRQSATRVSPQTVARSPLQPPQSRPATALKDQASTPVATAPDMGSPVTSQQKQSKQSTQYRQPQSQPSANHKSASTELDPAIYDDSKFTDEDYDLLLNCALDIQNVRVGRYQESWMSFAEAYSKCTAIEWRAYYERRVLPVVLQNEDDPEFQKGRGDGEWARFWQNQGQPIKTLPHLKKRAAADVSKTSADIVDAEDETTPRASRASALNEDQDMADVSDMSTKRKVQNGENAEQGPSKRRRTESPQTVPAEAATPSGPAQQATVKDDEIISISSKVDPSSSFLADEEETAHEAEAAQQLRREMEETRDARHQLTRANLARIEAQNGFSEDGEKRGIDLEKDEEDDDQADFIDVLGSLLPPGLKERAMEAAEARTHQADEEYADDDEDEVEDEDVPTPQEQPMEERVYDPAFLESSPAPEPNSYQSSAEFLANDTQMQLDPPETRPWEASSAPSQPQENFRQDTQAIYDAETQPFDQDIAPPPSQFDDEDPNPYYNTDSQVLADDEVWPWVDSQIALGFSEEFIKEALRVTSLNPKLAKFVLKARGGRVNMAGVWTEEEDAAVEGGDANAMRVLEKKHGVGSVMARWDFLKEWRHDQEVAEDEQDVG